MANEDFTTYTEVDPQDVVVITDANTITITGIRDLAGEITAVYLDKGADYFEDFIHKVEFTITQDSGANNNIFQSLGDKELSTGRAMYVGSNSRSGLLCRTTASETFALQARHYPDTVSDVTAAKWVQDTKYFMTIEKVHLGGSNNNGYYTCDIRTGSHAGALVESLAIEMGVGHTVKTFQFLYGYQNYTFNGNHTASTIIENLDIGLGVEVIGSIAAATSRRKRIKMMS